VAFLEVGFNCLEERDTGALDHRAASAAQGGHRDAGLIMDPRLRSRRSIVIV
jgi:hypothetical protein